MQATLPAVPMASVVGVLPFAAAIQIATSWEIAVLTSTIYVLQVNSPSSMPTR